MCRCRVDLVMSCKDEYVDSRFVPSSASPTNGHRQANPWAGWRLHALFQSKLSVSLAPSGELSCCRQIQATVNGAL